MICIIYHRAGDMWIWSDWQNRRAWVRSKFKVWIRKACWRL